MTLRLDALVIVQGWSDDLTACLESLGNAIDDVRLACTVPGLGPAVSAAWSVPVLGIECGEAVGPFLHRAASEGVGDAWLFLRATDRLTAPPETWRASLTETDALAVPVRSLRRRVAEGTEALSPDHPESLGAVSAATETAVRVVRRSALAGFYSAAAPTPRLAPGAQVRQVDAGPAVLAAHALYDQGDQTPQAAYQLGARADVAQMPPDAEALAVLADRLEQVKSFRTADAARLAAYRLDGKVDDLLAVVERHLSFDRTDAARNLLAPLVPAEGREGGADCSVLEAWARVLMALGDGDRAWQVQQRCLAIQSEPTAAMLLAAARIALRAGALAEVHTLTDQVLALDPADLSAHVLRALAYMRDGLAFRAVPDLKIALDVEPSSPSARQALAAARHRLGLPTDADATAPVRPATPLPHLGPRGVLSFIPHLAGGAGRVAVDIIRALGAERPQALITLDAGDNTGLDLRAELDDLGIPIATVVTRDQMTQAQTVADAGLVLAHYWPNPLPPPSRRPGQRRVAISHGTTRLPEDFDDFVCLTPDHAAKHVELPSDRLTVIPNGVDCYAIATTPPDEALWSPRTPGRATVRIALLSRLTHTKLYARLLQVLDPIADLDVEAVVAGAGPRRWQIERRLGDFAIGDRVRFIGPIASSRTAGFLRAADIGLHLTQTHRETLSIALLEMMAAGLPLVGQPRGCLPMLVENGVNGWLAEDETALSAALRALVQSPEQRRRFGEASRQRAGEYDISRFDARWRRFVADRLDRPTPDEARRRPTPPAPSCACAGMAAFAAATAAPGRDGPPRGLIVAASPRVGGTFFLDLLSRTQRFGHLGEHLAAWDNARQAGCRLPRPLDEAMLAEWAWSASLDGRAGCRVAFPQFEVLCRQHGGADWPSRWLDRLSPLFWLRLVRRDRVAQAVSDVLARATGKWSDRGLPTLAAAQPAYDAGAIAETLARIEAAEAGWDRFFADHGIVPLTLVYETLVADPTAALRAVFDALGEPMPATGVIESEYRRQADTLNADWIRAFRATHGPASRDAADLGGDQAAPGVGEAVDAELGGGAPGRRAHPGP